MDAGIVNMVIHAVLAAVRVVINISTSLPSHFFCVHNQKPSLSLHFFAFWTFSSRSGNSQFCYFPDLIIYHSFLSVISSFPILIFSTGHLLQKSYFSLFKTICMHLFQSLRKMASNYMRLWKICSGNLI